VIFNSNPAAVKEWRALGDVDLGVFRVLVNLADNRILLDRPEILQHFTIPWRSDYKWVVRTATGKMQKDASGKWMIYTYGPASASAHQRRGVAERWAILPTNQEKRSEAIREASTKSIDSPRPDYKMLAAGDNS
jgi:hypothetical protein